MKKYLIVYYHTDKNRVGFGNVQCEMEGGITLKTICKVEKHIKANYMNDEGNVVIINIIKLKGEEQ